VLKENFNRTRNSLQEYLALKITILHPMQFGLRREASRRTLLPGNRVSLLQQFCERNNWSSMEFLLRPIDNVDQPHQLIVPLSIQGRNTSPLLQNYCPYVFWVTWHHTGECCTFVLRVLFFSCVDLRGQTSAHFLYQASELRLFILISCFSALGLLVFYVLGLDFFPDLFALVELKSSDKGGEVTFQHISLKKTS